MTSAARTPRTYEKMTNPEAKALWIKALKSGKYVKVCGTMRQGVGYRNEGILATNEMCVMGVLADVALQASGLPYCPENWHKFATTSNPTSETLKWAGLSPKVVTTLIHDNDARKKDFGQFAEFIEENL